MSEKIKWSELSPIQRNALIAEKVMGWQWIAYNFHDVSSCNDQLWLLPNGESITNLTNGEWTYYEEDEDGSLIGNRFLPYWIPDYSTDMNAAIKIVELEQFSSVEIKRYWRGSIREKCNYRITVDDRLVCDVEETLPVAICLAALQACGVEIES